MPRWLPVAAVFALAAALVVGLAQAQPAGDEPAQGDRQPDAGRGIGFLRLIHYSGPVGYIIIAISIAAVALVIEQARSIRRDRLMPPNTVADLQDLVRNGQFKEALVRCEQDDSFVSSVVGAALSVVGSGSTDQAEIQTAMVEAGEEQTARLYRRIEYLSLIGNVAPMLGLLGTVTGMILAFNEIAMKAERVRPPDLAHGISQALVTTCMGLIVAIPTMTAFVLLRNRIDALVGEAEAVVAQLTSPFRRLSRRPARPGTKAEPANPSD
ncbi:MAG: hypothetical protein AMS14_05165 [Planctomycetes bacterium DG_20]|nr:MAG: hypothetical protein AMS14_05165 [Planctomycetes bacterium DG_20]